MSENVDKPLSGDTARSESNENLGSVVDEESSALSKRLRRQEENNYVTGRIGETCRFMSFGILAIFYTLLTSETDIAVSIVSTHNTALFIAAIFASATILFDYLQYLCGAISTRRALNREDGKYLHNKYWLSLRFWHYFFWSKQVCIIVAVGMIVQVIVTQFLSV